MEPATNVEPKVDSKNEDEEEDVVDPWTVSSKQL